MGLAGVWSTSVQGSTGSGRECEAVRGSMEPKTLGHKPSTSTILKNSVAPARCSRACLYRVDS